MSQSLVSIIIPTKNNEKTIEKCLNSILFLNYYNFELILVNDASTDSTPQILESFKIKFEKKNISYIVLNTHGVGPSSARNLALNVAKGDYIAFTDADCIVDKEWLNELLKGFVNEKIAGVGGNQLSPNDDTEFGKTINTFMKSIGFITDYVKSETKKNLIYTSHNPTCNVMYRKEIFNQVGYFLEGLWPAEDVELDYRIKKAGYKLVYNPNAVVYHYRPNNLKKFINMMIRYGEVQAVLVKKYGFFRIIHFLPLIFFLIISIFLFLLINNIYLSLKLVFFSFIFFYVFFLLKAKNIFKAFKFLFLLILTILMWNKGFVIGLFKK